MRYQELESTQRRLVDLMSELQFGTIHNLAVSDGVPTFFPAPLIVREIRFGSDLERASSSRSGNFEVKAKVAQLLALCADLGHGTIQRLYVRHGSIPHRLWVQEVGHA